MTKHPLTKKAKDNIISDMIRVNQAGEFGAQKIYEGQLSILKNDKTIKKMMKQEKKHLEAFNKIIIDKGVRPTALSPFWSIGGYLLGMLLASFVVGYLAERNYDKNYFKSLFVIFLGTLIIFIPGLIWLGFWFDNFHPKLAENIDLFEGYKLALTHGLLVFKFTEPVKVALAASITPLLWQYISKK